LSQWRRWSARIQLGDVPEAVSDDAGLQRSEEWDALRRALALLPARRRAVLVVRYFEDLPDPAIAELLACRLGTVRSLASRGLAALRPLMAAGMSARLSYGSSILKASRSVRLPACGRRYALYVGGILVRHPACVTIAVTGPDGRSATVSVPVLPSCPRRAQ